MKIDNDQWNSYFNLIYCTTIDRYSREIQLKIMHRYLPVNKLLFKWYLIDSARCLYCFLYKESLDHIFYECLYARNLYYEIKEWLEPYSVNMPPYTLETCVSNALMINSLEQTRPTICIQYLRFLSTSF